jgi:hypothetical protein
MIPQPTSPPPSSISDCDEAARAHDTLPVPILMLRRCCRFRCRALESVAYAITSNTFPVQPYHVQGLFPATTSSQPPLRFSSALVKCQSRSLQMREWHPSHVLAYWRRGVFMTVFSLQDEVFGIQQASTACATLAHSKAMPQSAIQPSFLRFFTEVW